MKSCYGLTIDNNDSLQNFFYLDSLQTAGVMSIKNNDLLFSTEGLYSLLAVSSDFTLFNNPDFGWLYAPNIAYINGDVSVTDNVQFEDCCVLIEMRTKNVITGTLIVQNNGGGCSSVPEIYVSCASKDPDKDGVYGLSDNCPNDYNPSQVDNDGDGWGNPCDNCPNMSNPDQADSNMNFIGDICEVAEPGKAGINTTMPNSGLEIMGSDVYINDPARGLIIKNYNGQCFRVYLDGEGNIHSKLIECPN